MYDLLIRNATIYDGTENEEALHGAIAIAGDTIASVGHCDGTARRTLDADGLVACPAFIDIHSHADLNILAKPTAPNYLKMGVGTVVTGQCGISMAPLGTTEELFALSKNSTGGAVPEDARFRWTWRGFGEFCRLVEEIRPGVNILPMVGHGSARTAVSGFRKEPLGGEDIARLVNLLDDALREGAWGVSTGLFYPPGCFSSEAEMDAVFRLLGRRKALHATHMRDESDFVVECVAENIALARRWGFPLQISHHKASGRKNRGKVRTTMEMLRRARDEGLDVAWDAYPYHASSTGITICLPDRALEGGKEAMLARLRDPDTRTALRREMLENPHSIFPRESPPESIMIANCPALPRDQGRMLSDILGNGSPEERTERFFDWLLACGGDARAIFFAMDEEDVAYVISRPGTIIGSDSRIADPADDGAPHPRVFGTFPRFLRHFVLERNLLSLGEGIHRITGLPAKRLGLRDRGVLRPGARADIVLFDPSRLDGGPGFGEPPRFAEGIVHLFVNGVAAVEEGRLTSSRSGRVCLKTSTGT